MLPENTILGSLTMLEYYEYLDFPLLFLAINEKQQYFLAAFVEDSAEMTKFIYVKLPLIIVDKFRMSEYNLYTVFVVESLQKYIVTIKADGDMIDEVNKFDETFISNENYFIENITTV